MKPLLGVPEVFHLKPYPDNVEPLRNTPVEAVNASCLVAKEFVKHVRVIRARPSHRNVPVNSVFTHTLYSKPANEPISYITGLQAALNAKQNNLVASTDIFLNGSTLTGYGLMWNTNSSPTLTIKDLHF